MSRFGAAALWQAGFRPFFLLAMVSGMLLPLLWVGVYGGWVSLPQGKFGALQWHAHEMLFGFGWAVLGGFLLTATKNWVGIRGYHGGALIFLAATWLFERAGMLWGGDWPPALFWLSNLLFLVAIVTMLAWTLLRHRATDSYGDNFVFLLVLPLFPFAKLALLDAEQVWLGVGMALALFRVAFLVMLERTLVPFMKGAFQVTILRHPALDGPIKVLGLLLVFAPWLPDAATASAALMLALLLMVRFAFWHPGRAFSRIDIGIMYLGYGAIVFQLLVEAWRLWSAAPEWASLSLHIFTFGAMGLIVPAMIIRISQGHTGRKVVFSARDRLVLLCMVLAFVLRIVMPLLFPQFYTLWIVFAAACWCAAYGLLAWRYIPMLLQPRIDGRVH